MARPVTLVGPGSRVWSDEGLAGAVTRIGPDGMHVRVDREQHDMPVDAGRWQPAGCCDYCDQPAEVRLIDGQPDDMLCRRCAHSQFDRPDEWVRPLHRTDIRQWYARQG